MLKIRLQRTGRNKTPFYRVVVAEHSASVKGYVIEKVGFYNPSVKPWAFEVDTKKILEWIKKGAKPSSTVARLLKAAGEKDMDKFVEIISDLDKNQEYYKPYYEQPLLEKEPKLDDAIQFVRNIVK